MENKENLDFVIFLAVGTFSILLLATSILVFFIIYKRKIHQKNQRLMQLKFIHQQELLDHHILATEDERKRLASDLHDDVGTRLSALRISITPKSNSDTDMISNIKDEIDEIITAVRNISHDIMPASIELFGLSTAVEQLTESMNRSSNIEFKTTFLELPDLSNEVSLSLYRITQELMHNALKHSNAKNAQFFFGQEGGYFKMSYQDDGLGIDQSLTNGLGIRNITNRARMIQADINWNPKDRENKGLAISLKIPLS